MRSFPGNAAAAAGHDVMGGGTYLGNAAMKARVCTQLSPETFFSVVCSYTQLLQTALATRDLDAFDAIHEGMLQVSNYCFVSSRIHVTHIRISPCFVDAH